MGNRGHFGPSLNATRRALFFFAIVACACGQATDQSPHSAGAAGQAGAGLSTQTGAGASSQGGGGASAQGGAGGASAQAGAVSASGSGGASAGSMNLGGAGPAVDPPLSAVEGLWQVARQSAMGTCAVEPSEWSNNGLFFKLVWDGMQYLNEYTCYSASVSDCSTAPSAYSRFLIRDGQWVAVQQDATDGNTCMWEEQRLKLLDSGVLRQIYGTMTVQQGCGPNQSDLATCTNGWIRESHRVN